jgi:hypothetical protein
MSNATGLFLVGDFGNGQFAAGATLNAFTVAIGNNTGSTAPRPRPGRTVGVAYTGQIARNAYDHAAKGRFTWRF